MLKRKRMMLMLIILILPLVLSGCYEIESTLVINEEGMADVTVEMLADEAMAGEEAAGVARQLDLMIPEININYEMDEEIFQEDFMEYRRVTFSSKSPVDIQDTDYHEITQNEDGSFEFVMNIPSMEGTVSEEEEDDTAMTFTLKMPREISMANTTNVEDNTASWSLTQGELTTETELQAITE